MATQTPARGVPCLAYAIVANSGQSVHNSGTLVDSYRSSLGAYGGGNRFSGGNVRAGTQIVLNGGADIQGIQNANSAAGLTPLPTPVSYIDLGNLNIEHDYTFMAGDYLVESLNVNGSPKIRTEGGRVRIWFRGLNLAGSVGYGSQIPDNLWFFSRDNAWQVNLNGSCQLNGVIFAPNIPINDSASNAVHGALVGSSVTLNGNVAVHYDQDLGAACDGQGESLLARFDGERKSYDAWQMPKARALMLGPNPAHDNVSVFYRSGPAKRVQLILLTLAGDVIQTLLLQPSGDDVGRAEISLAQVASGVYLAVMQVDAGEGLAQRGTFKLAVVK